MALLPATITATVRPLSALNSSNDPSYVRILDTTLRDGEQAPGGAMTAEQKIAVARNLVLLGVDVIDAGFPISSPEDFNAVKLIADEVGNMRGGHEPVIMAAARCSKIDIDTAWAAVSGARRPRLGTFIATSEIHMKHKLKKNADEVVAIAREMVAYARSVGFQDISFAAEDSLRSDKDFLCRIFGEVIKAGARTVIIADTVGCSMPSEIGGFVAYIRDHTPGIENAIVSIHCHNDLGLANANTLAGIEAGAREVEVTINGIGERAGNAALEEVVMAIKCRKELMGGLYTGVNTKYLIATSKMVVECTGLNVQPHKAIVGANAFSHESGIHQDGVLKFKGTYEFISREDIGLDLTSEPSIVLGKLSGRHALKSRLLKLGYDLDGTELDDIFKKFKLLTAKKKNITDDDIEELVCSKSMQSEPIWSLGYLQVMHGTMGFSTAVVKLLNVDGQERIACSMGRGPVDAAYKAIDNIIQTPMKLVEYKNSFLDGIHAISLTQVVVSEDNGNISTHCPCTKANGYSNGHAPSEGAIGHSNGNDSSKKANGHAMSFSGSGESTDLVVSSVEAYLRAVNRMVAKKESS
ncbi:2-isopropylmalate synthase A [Dendrobium catenatum]|uniref:2-isopropylmalate synthase n=2 Tax=Dendrobium catenatum TaxID=906689 RepID=A0A2I0XEX7_9ASPA|nr:2-isopropylmalate synthase A [Dendrobium catenatum]